MNENIKGTIKIDYEIDPNSLKNIIDKHSRIILTENDDVYEFSVQNTPPFILKLIYEDLSTKLCLLTPIINVLKETLKQTTTKE